MVAVKKWDLKVMRRLLVEEPGLVELRLEVSHLTGGKPMHVHVCVHVCV